MLDTAQKFERVSRQTDSLLNAVSAVDDHSLESLEDTVLDLEAENEARHEILASSGGIEQELDESRKKERIEKALKELKAGLKKG